MPRHPAGILRVLAMVIVFTVSLPASGQGFPEGIGEALGPRYQPAPDAPHAAAQAAQQAPRLQAPGALQSLRRWNQTAIDASGVDHTPVPAGDTRVFGEQFGPGRSSRAMAIVHIAMFDAVNAIAGGFKSYSGIVRVRDATSIEAAIAQSAHDTLAALFPSQAASFAARLTEDLNAVTDATAKANGIRLGQHAAAKILALRTNDGSHHAEPRVGVDFRTGTRAGQWRQDPISRIPLALGAHWGKVKPFVLNAAPRFRAPLPPRLDSEEYAQAFEEVKRLGGDGIVTPTERTEEQTMIGIFWAYDGMPSLCAPSRLYNQIAMIIAEQMGSDAVQLARLLALVNVAMADAGIAIWESKYHYQFWRPVGGVREADRGTGPSGSGDGNPDTVGDAAFTPLGAPASNLNGPNFTPPFPAYPSGHAGFGGALFQILRNFYGRDDIAFTFVSDELNGVTRDGNGVLRPLLPRTFSSLSQAEEENGQSRVYLGIHWAFDKTDGIEQGRRVADYVFRKAFVPVNGR